MTETLDSLANILFLLLLLAAYFWPMYRIAQKAGFSGAWALLGLLSVFGVFIYVWMLAIREWPVEEGRIPRKIRIENE